MHYVVVGKEVFAIRPPAVRLLALILVAATLACGDDGPEKTSNPGDLRRYCDLTAELNRAGTEFFSGLSPDAGEKAFERAQGEFVRLHEAELNEVVSVAPEEIRADTSTVIAAQKATAGLGPEVPDGERLEAEGHVRAYLAEHCVATPTPS